MQTARLARVQALLPDSLKARTRFLSISIDPSRDSVAALAEYAETFKIDAGHWRLAATRDTAALARLMGSLGMTVKPGADGSADHEMAVLLIDASGGIAQRYKGDDFDEARLLREIGDVDRVLGKRHP
jgi:protein SCO1/2